VEVNFWDFVRNDNSNKGTTARLNEIRFGPKKKSSPIYFGLIPPNIRTLLPETLPVSDIFLNYSREITLNIKEALDERKTFK
jgi:hypothetical protein